MPTLVQFTGGQSFTVAEDFEHVNQQLSRHDGVVVNRLAGENQTQVAIYRSSVAYIEQQAPGAFEKPAVAAR